MRLWETRVNDQALELTYSAFKMEITFSRVQQHLDWIWHGCLYLQPTIQCSVFPENMQWIPMRTFEFILLLREITNYMLSPWIFVELPFYIQVAMFCGLRPVYESCLLFPGNIGLFASFTWDIAGYHHFILPNGWFIRR